MNDSTQQKAPHGRSLQIRAFGNTTAELERAALDEARAFFGDGPVLRVVPDYAAIPVRPDDYFTEQAAGRKYRAALTVLAVPQGLPSAQARLCGLLGGLRARMQAGRP